MTFAEIKDLLEAVSYAATVIGIPVAILVFIYEKRKDRLAQETETYLHANEKYLQYLALCLDHPEFDCFDLSPSDPDVLATGLDIRKLTLFEILISMLETGFLLYRRHSSAIRKSQWQGWHDYMLMWAARTDFRKAWPALGSQFDAEFFEFMNRLIQNTKSTEEQREPNKTLNPTGNKPANRVSHFDHAFRAGLFPAG